MTVGGLPFEDVRLSYDEVRALKATADDITKHAGSPFGQVPVLEIDGEIHPDSTDILFKLDELFPDPPLLSSDARISGQQKQLEDWADENLLWYFNKWLRSKEAAEGAPAAEGRIGRRFQRVVGVHPGLLQ